ncbi:MAG TPA: ABC transporter permease [Pirellulales bacterium]|jgi:ABC-type multidrug transport system permease subunit|nr:ABC transporter permease [Pirellulales bacterium]
MFRDAWFIGRNDLLHSLRERETILWVFIMPIMFFYFIGTITSGMGGAGGPGTGKDRLSVQVPDDAGFLAYELIRRLEAGGFQVVPAKSEEEFAGSPRRLAIPEGFTSQVLAGEKSVVTFWRPGADQSGQYDQVRVGRAVYTVLADLVASTTDAEGPGPETFRRVREAPRNLRLEVESAGERKEIPSGFEQAIPGTMVMFTLIVLLTSGAVTVISERRLGVLRRLATTPISRASIILGKWGCRLMLSFVQIGFAMIVGSLLFGMKWGDDLPMVLLVLAAWGGLCASLALLLGSLVSTEGQAVAIGVLTGNALGALGGCWWPIEIAPSWMQSLAICLPSGWAMDAMHRLISFRAGAASALPHVLVLFTAASVAGVAAARRFRFQ